MRLYRAIDANLFSPPYRFLPLAVFVYVALSFLYHPFSPFQTFALGDPDDYMRLNEVINWLQGQGWYDLSHPRMAPGAHTVLHWSRLVDLPIAILAWPLIKPFGMMSAALVASFIVPFVMLWILLALLPTLTAPLVGENRANLAAVFLLFAPMTLFNFTPGRVDHHGWQILIAGFGLLSLERMTRSEDGWRLGVYSALAFAVGLWIGTEALPWLMLFIACLALGGAWRGGSLLRNGAVFGASLAVATLCVLPLALPFDQWSSRALSWFSLADVIFAALSGGMLILSWALGRLTKKTWLRVAVICGLGFCAALLYFYFLPDAMLGPFADFDDFNSTTALEHINEATPLMEAFRIDPYNHLTYARAAMAFIRYVLLPLIALIAIIVIIPKARAKEKLNWIFQGVFLLAAFLLTIFWQVRIGWFLQMFAIAPLTWVATAWWKKIERDLKGRPRFWAEISAFLILGPLPVLLLPSAVAGTNLYPDLLLFPAANGGEKTCNLKRAAEFIASPFGRYTYRHYTILSGANEGPELLFRTPHNVIAGNFNVPSNRDVFEFFNARDEQDTHRNPPQMERRSGPHLPQHAAFLCRHRSPPLWRKCLSAARPGRKTPFNQ